MTSRLPRAAAAGLAVAALAVAACETPRPTAPRPVARPALTSVVAATAATVAPAGITPASEDAVRAALARHYPEVLTSATGRQQRVWFVADAAGRILQSARQPDDAPIGAAPALQTVSPSSVAAVEVVKLPAGRLAPDSLAVVWVTLRAAGAGAGAVPGVGAGAAPAPLYVVDGRELPAADARRTVDALDPDAIASVDVLKGEAAVRAHGERARGGVVRIATKARVRGS